MCRQEYTHFRPLTIERSLSLGKKHFAILYKIEMNWTISLSSQSPFTENEQAYLCLLFILIDCRTGPRRVYTQQNFSCMNQ
jgi:hypothetical protein